MNPDRSTSARAMRAGRARRGALGGRVKRAYDSVKGHDPGWLVRDVLVAGAIAAAVLLGQARIDSSREQEAQRLEDARSAQAERLENLRFVRERSSAQAVPRPFRSLDLQGQSLTGLQLRDASFDEADLSDADLTEAWIGRGSFAGADLTGAVLRDANAGHGYFVGADLAEADLSGLQARDSYFNEADLSGAVLNNANLEGGWFDGADLTGADTRWAYLADARLDTDLRGLDFRETDLRHAYLHNADLRGADLRHAHLRGAHLTDAWLFGRDAPPGGYLGPCYSESTRWPPGFTPPPPDCLDVVTRTWDQVVRMTASLRSAAD